MAWYGSKSDDKTKMPRSVLKNSFRRPFPIPAVKKYGKVKEAEKEEELLVFGYACKIFPPDEHSRAIDRGEHLIPWHDDASLRLLIDRYDARASLHDLSEFDGDSWNKQYQVSEEEHRIEALCDQERYMALHTNIAEENIHHEEELKRLHASIAASEDNTSFNEVGLIYEDSKLSEAQQYDPSNPTIDEEVCDPDGKEETPFMAPASLAIPSDMEIPPTEKMHAIIEKTALFVSKQGAQMEIVLKAKQSNNTQFQFLLFDHYLNPYYKHMVKRIKEGKYTPGISNKKNEDDNDEDSDDSSDDGGGYLHPSLLAGSSEKRKQRMEENREKFKAIQKVDPDHPLAKLIEKGKRANALRQYAMMQQSTKMQAVTNQVADSNVPPVKPTVSTDNKIPTTIVHPPPVMQSHSIAHVDTLTPIVPPPPDIQPMVDSVAKQIAEDGEEVERSMCARDDPMLSFLLPWHELYPYYSFRKSFFQQRLQNQRNIESHPDISGDKDKDSCSEIKAETENNNVDYKPEKSAPISFAIKPKKESTNKPGVLNASKCLQILDDESDNEEENVQPSNDNEDLNDSKMETVNGLAESNSFSQPVSTCANEDKGCSVEDANGLETVNEDLNSQTKEMLPSVKKIDAFKPAVSSFAVVTPSGTTASLSNLREKQAARRQKAMLFLKMKNDIPSNMESAPKPLTAVASEDIFDIEEDAASPVNNTPSATDDTPQDTSASLLKIDQQLATKRSVPPSTAPSSTLKDLVAAASSRSNTPNSLSVSVRKDEDRSRSRSRSRYSSPSHTSRKRRSRSGSHDLANLPSSYRKTRSPPRKERSSSRDRQRSHKRHRHDDRESKHRKKDSSSSLSRKSKKHSSKSKKKHKKKEKQKSKKRKSKTREDSYEEGERRTSSSDEASSVENHTNYNETPLTTDVKENNESGSLCA